MSEEKEEKYVSIKIKKSTYQMLSELKHIMRTASFDAVIRPALEVYREHLTKKAAEVVCKELAGVRFPTIQDLVKELQKVTWSPLVQTLIITQKLKQDERGLYIEC